MQKKKCAVFACAWFCNRHFMHCAFKSRTAVIQMKLKHKNSNWNKATGLDDAVFFAFKRESSNRYKMILALEHFLTKNADTLRTFNFTLLLSTWDISMFSPESNILQKMQMSMVWRFAMKLNSFPGLQFKYTQKKIVLTVWNLLHLMVLQDVNSCDSDYFFVWMTCDLGTDENQNYALFQW